MELCFGCGIRARERHPWGAVVNVKDAGDAGVTKPGSRGFVGVAVCNACHADPAHRSHAIKGTFFPREALESAAQSAGSNDVKG